MEQMEQFLPIKKSVEEKKRLFLSLLEDPRIHGNVSNAIKASGIKRTTAYRWKKKDKDFAERWDILVKYADEMLAELVEYKLLEKALRGNVRAQIFILKHRRPEEWNTVPYCRNCNRQTKHSLRPF